MDIYNPHLEGSSFLWEGGEVGVLLCHGFTATTAEVRPLAKCLHEHGCTVAGPLLPGHGTKPEDLNRCHWQDWTSALEAAYKDLNTRCRLVFVGGESMGALLSLYLAGHHPEIAGILSYAAALRVYSPYAPFYARCLAPFIRYRAKAGGTPRVSDAAWQGYFVNPTSGLVELFRLQKIVYKLLPEIRQPILLVHGREDQTIQPVSSEIIYRRAQSRVKELHWMDQSGHCVILDCELDQVKFLSLNFLEMVLAIPQSLKG